MRGLLAPIIMAGSAVNGTVVIIAFILNEQYVAACLFFLLTCLCSASPFIYGEKK